MRSGLRSIQLSLVLCAPLVLTGCLGANGAPEAPTAGGFQTEEVAMNYVDTYNGRDLAALADVLTDPIEFNGTEYDRDTFLGFVDVYWESFPILDLHPTHIVSADDYVTVRVEMSATGQGEYLGHSVHGKEAQATELMLFRIRDGRVAEYWSNWDELGFLAQLGIVSRP